jgi:hypothetical protein
MAALRTERVEQKMLDSRARAEANVGSSPESVEANKPAKKAVAKKKVAKKAAPKKKVASKRAVKKSAKKATKAKKK